jgi:competence protein ComEA
MFEFTVRQKLAALTLLFFLSLGGSLLFFSRDNQGYTEEYRIGKDEESLYVHVCGAVANPGIIEVKPGTRKHEALQLAGGALPEGDLNQINLAEYVLDGEQIYLPKKGEIPQKATRKKVFTSVKGLNTDKQGSSKPAVNFPYDLNSATQNQLEQVPGIGPALAERILKYRTEHGKFNSYEDLLKVPGIGGAKLEKFRSYLVVK